MPASITKTDTGVAVGRLATYSISKSNVPTKPSDSSGQIPTFSATVTNTAKDAKQHVGDSVTLTDLNGEEMVGDVVSATRGANSGMLQLDMNTVFERLNTEQTTYPVIGDSTDTSNLAPVALDQWLLMAGIPQYRMPGNLLHYVTNKQVGYSSRSVATWVQAPFAQWPADHARSIPTFGPDLGRLDVNRAQSMILGMPLYNWNGETYVTDVVLNTFSEALNTAVRYRLLQVGKVISVQQSIGAAAYTDLATMTIPTDATVGGDGFLYVLIKGHATVANNAAITIRVIGQKLATGQPVNYDHTVASVATYLRKRPALRSIDLGSDATKTGIHISPYLFFISEGSVLPFERPKEQVEFRPDNAPKPLTAIPGFTANVWEKIKELCALAEIDILFGNDRIIFTPRRFQRSEQFGGDYIPMLPVAKANVVESASQREKSRSVEVVYREQPKQSVSAYYNNELWRSESVYSIAKGETKVELIQTDSTFLTLNQPVPVSGVPVPYTLPYGTYVITGNDGYIVDPLWWTNNGGSIKVSPTAKAGEIEITMQAPQIDTVRAPYRVSEGVADRPALYIFGNGLKLAKPKTLKVYTGNPDASEDVGTKFDSPFITNKLQAFNAGHRLAITYGSGDSGISLDLPRKEKQEGLGALNSLLYPAELEDPNLYFNRSAYRVEQYSIGHTSVNVSKAVRFNTHRIINGEYATGKTIGQQNAMQSGMKIKDTNLSPLPEYLS